MWPLAGLLKGPGFLRREDVGLRDLPSPPGRTQSGCGGCPSLSPGGGRCREGAPQGECIPPEAGAVELQSGGSTEVRRREGG